MFDSVLRREALPSRRFGSGALLGLLVYAGLAAYAVWLHASGPKAARDDLAIRIVAPRPPPPPPPPAAQTQPLPRPTNRVPPMALAAAIVAPTAIPEMKPPEQERGSLSPGLAVDFAHGDLPHVPGGSVGPVVEKANVPVDFDERMTHPEFLSGPSPKYTEKAIERDVEGTAVVRCVVTAQGRVHDCKAVASLPYMDAAVIEALERRRYKPATLGGRPVEVNYVFRITLRLD